MAAVITTPEFFEKKVIPHDTDTTEIRPTNRKVANPTAQSSLTMDAFPIFNSSTPSTSSSSPTFKPRVCLDKSRTLKAVRTDFGRSTTYSLLYLYSNQVLFTFLPLLLLMVFNLLLLRQVVRASRERSNMAPYSTSTLTASNASIIAHPEEKTTRRSVSSPRSVATRGVKCGVNVAGQRSNQQLKDQQRITVMLITLVVLFILCQLPQSLQNLYRVYRFLSGTLTGESVKVMLITGNIFNFLVIINCGSNFILYSILSTRFRTTFARLCCTKR